MNPFNTLLANAARGVINLTVVVMFIVLPCVIISTTCCNLFLAHSDDFSISALCTVTLCFWSSLLHCAASWWEKTQSVELMNKHSNKA